ncbi:hypothetical protein QO200_18685 [Flavobacterium sp. Arc3]|uniref:hypothetical protein n=1 Tax=Flavobacterium sp. Arc3 TaxID=3046686 RepID=UPI00352C8A11
MNKEQTVIDFATFTLMDVEELIQWNIINFFGQKDEHDPFSDKKILEYEDFIKEGILTSEIILNQNCNLELKSISDLLSTVEINNLLNYLNENFTEGYPDGDGFGPPTNLKFTTSDLYRLFNKYLELRKYNQNVFISYYKQMLHIIEFDAQKFIEIEKHKIINIEKTKDLLNLDLSTEYIENKKNEYKRKLFKSIENNNFQFKGFSDEKGLYFDFNKSLISYLEFLNKEDHSKIVYTVFYKGFENSLDYLLYQFLEDKLFNTKNIENNDSTPDNKDLLKDLSHLKEKHKKLVVFLSTKNFIESEIDVILNILANNKYSNLNKRNISDINQIEFYNFCYLFYILEYFEENENIDFSKLKNFKYILNFDKKNILNYSKTDYQKYFKGIDSHTKKIDKLYEKIEKDLQITKERLKPIP